MNLPNRITLARIIFIPFVIFFYLATFIPYCKLISLVLFLIAIFTDFLDGYLARKLGQVSTLGVFLDTIADKMLTLSIFALILCTDATAQPIGVVSFIIVLCRELIVSALRQLAASKNVVIMADMWGKVKANFQFFTIAFFLLLEFLTFNLALEGTIVVIVEAICYVLLGLTVASTLMSGVHYMVKNRAVFKEEKANS